MIDTEEKKYVADLCAYATGTRPRDVVAFQGFSFPTSGNNHSTDRVFYVRDFIGKSACEFRNPGAPGAFWPEEYCISLPYDGVQTFQPPMSLDVPAQGCRVGLMCYHVGGVICHGIWKHFQSSVEKVFMIGYECLF